MRIVKDGKNSCDMAWEIKSFVLGIDGVDSKKNVYIKSEAKKKQVRSEE